MRLSLSVIVAHFFMAMFMLGCGGNRIETRDHGPQGPVSTDPSQLATTSSEPVFRKEGYLQFISATGDTLSKIEIEVAATDSEREQGLMYRTDIKETTGMLFLFEKAEYQSFWMKNTPSSLDILFISPSNAIVNIHTYTSPYSLDGLPSTGLADKVVEVKAGYCDKYKIKAGGKIAYQLDNRPI